MAMSITSHQSKPHNFIIIIMIAVIVRPGIATILTGIRKFSLKALFKKILRSIRPQFI
jgi:hypothetical protein